MKGQILHLDETTGEGIVSAADGRRYPFGAYDLKGTGQIAAVGVAVDFQPHEGRAVDIYPDPGAPRPAVFHPPVVCDKSRVTAGFLAVFLGAFGAHKFYLGYKGAGVAMLLITVFGWPLLFIPSWIMGLIGLIEGVLYLLRSDTEFRDTYVTGRRAWF